ncbi:branched-chain amino acid transport system substrate-binding protein [Rhodoligotrophos appendicifer]|uniref:branched-chain amino acid ABC transporter substrate-binding protein n=1 Tax=Rhodoligotrophos appendicifer TaxID=987056 RepID=UPI0011851A17|nr:branched-chain amino acid ABC transporter substrate-binding protein [Rhodoligotrophos appendicifer]
MGNPKTFKPMTRRFFTALATAAVMGAASFGSATAQETIKIGFIGPVSGGNAQQGLGARNGFLLAVEQANAGGYPYKIEPVALDDASDPQTGVSAALKLVNDPGVVGAIGHWNSPVALATIPVFNRYQMPFIVWGAISPKITEQNLPVVTRVTPTLVNENMPLATWVAKDLKATKIAIVSDTNDYGKANTDSFSEFFKNDGGEILASEAVPVGTTDFRAILTRIKGLSPEAIYFGGVITEAGILRKQMSELGLDIPLVGISGFYDPEFIKIAGDAANGTLVSYPKAATNPKQEAMYKAYEERKFAEPTSPYTKYAFDATNILLQAIKEKGIEDKAAIAEAIRAIKYDGVLGVTTFDENGQTQVPVEIQIKEVKGGAWTDR